MPLSFAFRLSVYLTLALASACLGYAEFDFLPEVTVFAGIVGVMLVSAFALEGRWALTIPAANLVGLIIMALLGIWFAYQYLDRDSLMHTLPWPTSSLPYLGPVLMVGMAAKLLRPKDAGDYWGLLGISLIMAALAGAMADDFVFAGLLLGYLVAGVWSLTLFYLYRECPAPAGPEPDAGAEAAAPRPGGRVPWLGRSARWAMGVLAAGLMLFLATPRSPGGHWDLNLMSRARLEVGYRNDPQVDLNLTGTLEVSDEVAFEVYAETADGRPKLDLPPSQRFGGRRLIRYREGTWRPLRQADGVELAGNSRPRLMLFNREGGPRLPDFGPDQYFLTFTLHSEPGAGEFLAEPVWWVPDRPPPVVSLPSRGGPQPWFPLSDGSFSPLELSDDGVVHYRQVTRPPPEPGLGPPLRIQEGTVRRALGGAPPRLRRWTAALLERLADAGELPAEALRRDTWDQSIRPEYHEAVARALCRHLAESGEYTYTLTLRRQDRSIDPVEDFLFNTRAGHCNRFASALVLMLRSQGIPAQLALGFRGPESQGGGRYVVRQSSAHAWAEVLIRRPDPDRPGEGNWHWLTLDPTPESGPEEDPAEGGWWAGARKKGEEFFREFIVGYDADRRDQAGAALWGNVRDAWKPLWSGPGRAWLIAGAGLLAAAAAGALYRRRRAARRRQREPGAAPPVPFQARLLEILARHGYRPLPAQTAREFAAALEPELARRLPGDPLARLPGEAAGSYYRVRFGGEELSADELDRIGERLTALDRALREAPRPDTGYSD